MAMRLRVCCGTFLAVAMGLASAGCGGNTLKVKGKVTLDGAPVEGATISFVPAGGGEAHPATGFTDSDGYFTLSSTKEGDGAWPGEYKVVISKKEGNDNARPGKQASPDDPPTPQSKMPDQAKAGMRGMGGNKYGGPKKDLLPKIYGDPATTPLRQTVPASGSIEFDLKSEGN
jgi:hypothetical protein